MFHNAFPEWINLRYPIPFGAHNIVFDICEDLLKIKACLSKAYVSVLSINCRLIIILLNIFLAYEVRGLYLKYH